MASLQILYLLGGSWFFLVTFLVLGMCRQKYMRRASPSPSSSSNFTSGRGSSNSTPSALGGARVRDFTPAMSSMPSTASSSAAAAAAGKVGGPKKA
ncbi:hypothetical protein ACJ72_03127 [Emergomyces africanus]|uniref:Uncharacterized protein n=1 Tax=Emergomyces africanus TaxID=1955775 RepID=A0A1B7P0W9_9EURO|nr:hypothetical protein ACJ72_03127 [Emergomyces africanus]